jgi:hypothetical protein
MSFVTLFSLLVRFGVTGVGVRCEDEALMNSSLLLLLGGEKGGGGAVDEEGEVGGEE